MKLFVFFTVTGYGEFITGIVHNSIEEAFEFKSDTEKSLKDKCWDIKDLMYSIECNDSVGIKFEGGGDLA